VIVSRSQSNATPAPPPHQWRNGLFVAQRLSPPSQVNPPWDYLMKDVRVKGGDHEPVTSHDYLMTIETLDATDGCPKRVTFYTPEHSGDSGDDHPGHSDAQR
jgi:hypothetical protein